MTIVLDDQQALCQEFLSRSRWAKGGYCGIGVYNILDAIGMTDGLPTSGRHGYAYAEHLPNAGWIKLEGITPENAPPGAVLVYDKRPRSQQNGDGGGGDEFGHVEIVAVENDGSRKYVSDKARTNFGGTVPDRFVGAYIHPDMHKQIDRQTAQNMLAGSGVNIDDIPTLDDALGLTREERERRQSNDTLLLTDAARDPAGPASNVDEFNNAAQYSAFVIMAALMAAMFGVDMDLAPATAEATKTPDPVSIDPAIVETPGGAPRSIAPGAGAGAGT